MNVLCQAGEHILVSALPNDRVLRVLTAAEFADTVHEARFHLGRVPVKKMLVINDLGAGGPLVDWL